MRLIGNLQQNHIYNSIYEIKPGKRTIVAIGYYAPIYYHLEFPWTYFSIQTIKETDENENNYYRLNRFSVFCNDFKISNLKTPIWNLEFNGNIGNHGSICLGNSFVSCDRVILEKEAVHYFYESLFSENCYLIVDEEEYALKKWQENGFKGLEIPQNYKRFYFKEYNPCF